MEALLVIICSTVVGGLPNEGQHVSDFGVCCFTLYTLGPQPRVSNPKP